MREGSVEIVDRVDDLPRKPFLSVVTRVEVEGGVYASSDEQEERRTAVDALLSMLPLLDFDFEMAGIYGRIVAEQGFSRHKVIDRMIAATALVSGMTLVTTNPGDFSDIDGLKLEAWTL